MNNAQGTSALDFPTPHPPTFLFQYQQTEVKPRIGRVGDISLLLGVFPLPSLRYTINFTVKDEDNVLMYLSVNKQTTTTFVSMQDGNKS